MRKIKMWRGECEEPCVCEELGPAAARDAPGRLRNTAMKHVERHHSKHAPEQLFDLVVDVERYPGILPWVISARVTRRIIRAKRRDGSHVTCVGVCAMGESYRQRIESQLEQACSARRRSAS